MSLSIIIAAAGKGTRLYSESIETCKPLLMYRNFPIIKHLLDVYQRLSTNIIVVVSGDFKGQFLRAWLNDYYGNPSWLKIIEQPKPAGTNDAVSRAMEFVDGSCLISWSDFIIDEEFAMKFNQELDNQFFESNIACRYANNNGQVSKQQSDTGFIGLYYFNQKPQLNIIHEEFLDNFIGQSVHTTYINAINLGTISDLVQTGAFDQTKNRFFNEVIMKDDVVLKMAKDNYAISLQEKEVAWYETTKFFSNDIHHYLPKVKYHGAFNTIELERIKGRSPSQCKLTYDFWCTKLPRLISSLHYYGYSEADEEDCQLVYTDKPKARYNEVKSIIDAWFDRSIVINGIDYRDWKWPEPPKDLTPDKFSFGHWDLTFNNILIDDNGNIRMIDPRGSFGKTMWGDPAYDVAKLLYSVDNYHLVNEGQFLINKLDNGNTIFTIKETILDENSKWFFNWVCDRYAISKEKLNYLLFGIWMSLTSYIKNNPLAIIASYCKALIRSREFVL